MMVLIPANWRRGPLPKIERGLQRLTHGEYCLLHNLYALHVSRKNVKHANTHMVIDPSTTAGKKFASLYRKGYVDRASIIRLDTSEEKLSYVITKDGILRLLNPGLLLVESVMNQ
ncbi:MAG TPA: hypothetical protein VIE65_13880 [Methylobacter sp.]|jgi:hypothetical protein